MKNFITFLIWFISTAVFFVISSWNPSEKVFFYVFLAYIIIVNVTGLYLMLIDKLKAMDGYQRIPEKILFRVTAIGGGIGTNIGMKLFRHKTKHQNFVFLLPTMTIVQYLFVFSIFSEFYFANVS